jgi:hypothetical protein
LIYNEDSDSENEEELRQIRSWGDDLMGDEDDRRRWVLSLLKSLLSNVLQNADLVLYDASD